MDIEICVNCETTLHTYSPFRQFLFPFLSNFLIQAVLHIVDKTCTACITGVFAKSWLQINVQDEF